MKKNKLLLSTLPIIIATSPIIVNTTCCNAGSVSLQDLITKLNNIEQVKQITVIKDCPKDFKYKLIVNFEQPVSWSDKTKGKFLQRVEFGFKSLNAINVVKCNGYSINDSAFAKECNDELVKRYNSNYINIEYRYFGKSKPSFYNIQNTSTWTDLTLENGIEDIHSIVTEFKKILTGKWISTGGSKGGQNTNIYAMTYPNDCNGYVSYSAPRCFTMSLVDKDALVERVVNSIGTECIKSEDKEKAAYFRDEVLKYQYYLLNETVATDLAQRYYKKCTESNIFNKYVYDNPNCLYYINVMDLSVGLWQYNTKPLQLDQEVIDINNETDPEKKKEKAWEFFLTQCTINSYSFNSATYSYYVQAYKQMGYYNLNPAVYNTAFAKKGWTAVNWIGIKKADYETLLYKAAFSEDFLTKIEHDDSMAKKLADWNKTTNKANVIMVYGKTDPWYAYTMEKSNNPNIHYFLSETGNHTSTISNSLPEHDRTEVWGLLDSWVQ